MSLPENHLEIYIKARLFIVYEFFSCGEDILCIPMKKTEIE